MKYRTPSYSQNVYDCFFFEKNLQGDIISVYREDGAKVITYTYDAWGNFTTTYPFGSSAASIARYNPFKYRGYYYDADLGLYYLQSRYYNPVWGRFINADGYVNGNGDILGFNMFAYCSNNPIMLFDPYGSDAMIVTDYGALPVVGHTVLYIQDEKGNWYKTQITVNISETINNILSGKWDIESKCTFKSDNVASEVEEHLNQNWWNNIGAELGLWGVRCNYIEGDFSACVEIAKNSVTSDFDYNLLTNNCLTYARGILKYGNFANPVLQIYNNISITLIPRSYSKRMTKLESYWEELLTPLPPCVYVRR